MRYVGGLVLLVCGVGAVLDLLDRASDPGHTTACISLGLCAAAALGVGINLFRDRAAPAGLGFAGIVVAAHAVLLPKEPADWQLVGGILAGSLAIALLVLAEVARRRAGGWERLRPHLRQAFGIALGKGLTDRGTRRTLYAFRAVHLALLPVGLFALASAVAAVSVRASVYAFALMLVLIGITRESMGWETASEQRRERRRARRGVEPLALPLPAVAPDAVPSGRTPRAASVRTPARTRRHRLTRGHPIGLIFAAVVVVVVFVGFVTSCRVYG